MACDDEGEHIWKRIVAHIARYGKSDLRTLRMIEDALVSEGFDQDLVQYHINRYSDGQRKFSPHSKPRQVIA